MQFWKPYQTKSVTDGYTKLKFQVLELNFLQTVNCKKDKGSTKLLYFVFSSLLQLFTLAHYLKE